MMGFAGLPRKLPEFLRQLASNNNREWFEANRDAFDRDCREPMLSLVDALAPFVAELDPPHRAEARLNGSIRRINRDTRFSRDKTPYHTHLHLIFWAGDHPNRSPGIHLIFAADGFGIGAGHWDFGKEGLERYRAAVTDPQGYSSLEKALDIAARDGQVPDPPALKRLPKGYEAEGRMADMLLRKGLVVRTQSREPYDERLFGQPCVDYLQTRMKAVEGVQRWIVDHVGMPTG